MAEDRSGCCGCCVGVGGGGDCGSTDGECKLSIGTLGPLS